MVDFNNDTIVNAPARNIITIIYLQRSEWLQDAWEEYHTDEANNIETTKSRAKIKARLISLFSRLMPMFKKSNTSEEFDKLKNKVLSDDLDDWKEATNEIENFLYTKNITKIDTTKPYDPTDLEEENVIYGL